MSETRKKTGPKKLAPYSEDVEENMKTFYNQLSEKDQRIYAAAEAQKLRFRLLPSGSIQSTDCFPGTYPARHTSSSSPLKNLQPFP